MNCCLYLSSQWTKTTKLNALAALNTGVISSSFTLIYLSTPVKRRQQVYLSRAAFEIQLTVHTILWLHCFILIQFRELYARIVSSVFVQVLLSSCKLDWFCVDYRKTLDVKEQQYSNATIPLKTPLVAASLIKISASQLSYPCPV